MAWYDDIQNDPRLAMQAVLAGPDEEDRKRALAMGALTAGLGILSTPRTPGMGPFTRVFQGGAGGVNAYNSSLADSRTQRKVDIQDALAVKKLTQQDVNAKTYADVLNTDKPNYLDLAKVAATHGDTAMMENALKMHERVNNRDARNIHFVPHGSKFMFDNGNFVPVPQSADDDVAKISSPVGKMLIDRGVKPGSDQWNQVFDAVIKKQTAPTTAMNNLDSNVPFDEGAIDLMARQFLASGQMPGLGLGNATARAQVANRANQLVIEAGGDPAAVPANRAGFKADTGALNDLTKRVAVAKAFAGNMDKQADLVEELLNKGASGGKVPIINRWIQAGRKQIEGDPDVTAFDIAVRGLAREHQRIVTGVTSNAQMHASAAQTADELLNTAMTTEQVRTAVKVMRKEAKNLIISTEGQADEIRGRMRGAPAPATSAPAPNSGAPATPASAAGGTVAGRIAPGAPPTGWVDEMGYEYTDEAGTTKTGRRFAKNPKTGKLERIM
jgi:hypothetical protein